MCESEVDPNVYYVNEERVFEDYVTILPNEIVFQDFAFFVEKRRINALADKLDENLLLKVMNVMKLKNRESGSENGFRKYNTLNGRWFEKTGSLVPKEDSSEIVKKKFI